MNGILWALAAGAGFGLFQSINARAMRAGGEAGASVYASTFVQLLAAGAVLVVASLLTTDVTVLADASAACLLLFVGAGVVHFFAGWTLLNLSQARIGAARTSPLLATTPLFGLLLGAVVATQLPAPSALAGIALTIAGALLVGRRAGGSGRRAGGGLRLRGSLLALGDAWFGLGTACAYAVGAVLIVAGLERFDHAPLLGVTVGVLAAAVAFGALLAITRTRPRLGGALRGVLGLKLAAALVVGLATWARWLALADADVAVVLALNLASVPVVMILAPLISVRAAEVVTRRIVLGATLVVAGALVLILTAR